MTIHAVPIPSLKVLFRALFAKASDGEPWQDPGLDKNIRFYSRGMWAMADAITAMLGNKEKSNCQVWIPDYFCDEPLIPLKQRGINLYFYPIKDDLSPDWENIELKAVRASSPDVFVLVHYFGFPNSVDKAKRFCNECGAELLEDCAHLLFPVSGAGRNTAVFSPRKFLPLPEGGLLIMPYDISSQRADKKFGAGKKPIFRWLILRLSQRLMLIMGMPWHHLRKVDNCNTDSRHVDKVRVSTEKFPCKYTLKLLTVIEEELKQVPEKRRANYKRLLQAVDSIKGVKPIFSSLPDHVCPYVLPMIVSGGRDAISKQLNHSGIPAASWPDLPREVLAARDQHKTAVWLQEHILLLPVHQDLSGRQVEYMAAKLNDILGKKG